MNRHTIAAKNWLDRRYSRKEGGDYKAHQPIYGLATACAEPNALTRFARTYRLLQRLHTLEFESVLDVGGGEGYLAAMVRDLFSIPIAHTSDLSAEACRRAGEIFDVPGAAGDATKLPFADKSYDVVICSEVIEHLSRPVAAMAELARIARKYVVITTAEFCPLGEVERYLRLWELDSSYPHAEMNWFTPSDLRGLFGDDIVLGAQYRHLDHLIPEVEWSRERVERALALLTASDSVDVDHSGVIAVCPRPGAGVWPERAKLTPQRKQQLLNRILEPQIASRDTAEIKPAELSQGLLDRLECVRCHGVLTADPAAGRISCGGCGQLYELAGGVPSMFVDGADDDRIPALDEECVTRLSEGDPERARSVRQVINRLHHPGLQSPPWKQKVGAQLLRVLWLGVRDESIGSKVSRIMGQLTGKPPVGAAEVHAALVPAQAGQPGSERLTRGEGVSRI